MKELFIQLMQRTEQIIATDSRMTKFGSESTLELRYIIEEAMVHYKQYYQFDTHSIIVTTHQINI